MNNLYLFQVNYSYGRTIHLPYTAAALAAYAMADPKIKEEYTLKKIFYLRESIDTVLSDIHDPAVIGFSTYIWNFEYNKAVAQKVKEKYPNAVILFGGHHVAPGGTLLKECPYIDYLIHGEGEEPFRRLLLSVIEKEKMQDISGISYRAENDIFTNPAVLCNDEYIDYPSPYLEGYLDGIVSENADKDIMGLIETSRGCPNSCSYCDWSNMKSRIRKFPLERVYAEIDWMCRHRIYGLGAADSNFGFFERDEEITDYIIGSFLRTGYPKGFQTSYAKNSNQRIFNIGKALDRHRLSKGVTLSFQSMSDEVLANIGRKNMPVESFSSLMKMYNNDGISTYTELILGLPGETYDSFSAGIDQLLNLGQHNSIYIHNCEWLPCSVMGNKDYIEKYQIKTAHILLNQPHIEESKIDPVPEYSKLVISTYSMTKEEWIRMNLFSFTVQCFHHMGIFQLIALYLHHACHVSYKEFYEKTVSWLLGNSGKAGKALKIIREKLSDIACGKEGASFVITDSRFGNICWSFEEYLFLCTVYEFDPFFDEAKLFLSSFFSDKAFFEQLFTFQKAMIKRPFCHTVTVKMQYSFFDYFYSLLENREGTLRHGEYEKEIRPGEFRDWADYAKRVVWYGRKDNRNIYIGDVAERA